MLLNREGHPTFRRSLPEQALQVLLTSTLSDTFYVGAEQLTEETTQVLRAACQADGELYARSLVYARQAGSLRLLPTYGTAILAQSRPDLLPEVFPRVVTTPRELRDLLKLCRRGTLRSGMGRALKRAVGRFLLDLSPHHLVKYGRPDGEFSLRDALRLARPRPRTAAEELKLRLVARGFNSVTTAELEPHWPTLAAWKRFRHNPRLELIEAGRLPYEVVVGTLPPTPSVWRALLPQMPQMAILRHLNTLGRHGLLRPGPDLTYVCHRLSDAAAVRRSRVLPFRYYTAWQAVAKTPPRPGRGLLLAALGQGLEASLGNLSALEGSVAVAVDVSWSMSSPIARHTSTRIVDVAALIGAALARHAPYDTVVLPFDTEVHRFELDPQESVFRTIDKLAGLCGGGTSLAAPLFELVRRGAKVEHFIGITDEEDWACEGGMSFLPMWRRYRELHPGATAYLLTLAPYRDSLVPANEPGVFYFYGWGEALVSHLALCARGGTQLDAVRNWKETTDD